MIRFIVSRSPDEINMHEYVLSTFRICDGDPDCVDGADENTTLHHCASPQPCGEGMFTCENGRCINKVTNLTPKSHQDAQLIINE